MARWIIDPPDASPTLEGREQTNGRWVIEAPDQRDDTLAAFASGAADTFSWGHGDELSGVAAGALGALQGRDYGATARRVTDESRYRRAQLQERNGGAFMAGQLAGAMVPGMGFARAGGLALKAAPSAARALQGVNWAGRVGLSAATGAAGGAVYGSGSADSDSMEDRFAMAGGYAIPGAVFGGALRGAGEVLGPPLSRMWRGRGPEHQAGELLGQAMAREGVTDDALRASFKEHADMDRGGMVLDSLGESGQHLAMGAAARPSAGRAAMRTALDERGKAMGPRAITDLWDQLGGGARQSGGDVIVDLSAMKRAEAQPFYEAAYSKAVNPRAVEAQVGELMRRNPEIFNGAKEEARTAYLSVTGMHKPNLSDPRYWHLVLQKAEEGLSARLRAASINPLQGYSGESAARATGVVSAFNRQMRTLLGKEFRDAQDLYSSATRNEDAVERGFQAVTSGVNDMKLAELAQWMRRARPGEIEHLRMGALSKLSDMLENADVGTGRADVLRSIMRSEGQRTMLARIFGGEGPLREVLRRFDYDRQLFANGVGTGIRTNSTTAPALAAQNQIETFAASPATTGGGLWTRIMGPEIRRAAERQNEAVSDELLRALATPSRTALAEMGEAGARRWVNQRGLLARAARRRDEIRSFREREALNAAIGGAQSQLMGGSAQEAWGLR